MGSGRYTPRLSIDITPETQRKMQELIPWGSGRPLITSLLEQILDLVEKVGKDHSNLIVAALISRKISLIDLIKNYDTSEKK